MNILEQLSRATYVVEYFPDEAARDRWERTVETFVEDYPAAVQRAAALGKDLPYVKVKLRGFADTDTFIAAFGTNVTHETTVQRYDRRGAYHCACGAWLKDDDHRTRHHELAGWEQK